MWLCAVLRSTCVRAFPRIQADASLPASQLGDGCTQVGHHFCSTRSALYFCKETARKIWAMLFTDLDIAHPNAELKVEPLNASFQTLFEHMCSSACSVCRKAPSKTMQASSSPPVLRPEAAAKCPLGIRAPAFAMAPVGPHPHQLCRPSLFNRPSPSELCIASGAHSASKG